MLKKIFPSAFKRLICRNWLMFEASFSLGISTPPALHHVFGMVCFSKPLSFASTGTEGPLEHSCTAGMELRLVRELKLPLPFSQFSQPRSTLEGCHPIDVLAEEWVACLVVSPSAHISGCLCVLLSGGPPAPSLTL